MSQINHGGAQLAEAVKRAYELGQDDYHLEPMVLTENGVPVGRIQDIMKKVSAGRMTPEEGGKELAKTCTCGIFNWKRAAEILSKI